MHAVLIARALLAILLAGEVRVMAAFPGVQGKIAFASNRSGRQEIYVMDSGQNQTLSNRRPWGLRRIPRCGRIAKPREH